MSRKIIKTYKLEIRCAFCNRLYEPDFSPMAKATNKNKSAFHRNLDAVVCPHCSKSRKEPRENVGKPYKARGQV